MSVEEEAAATFVAAEVGGVAEPRDGMTSPDGMHDFDVVLPSGRCIALEVTVAADQKMISVQNKAFGWAWPAPALSARWCVGFAEAATDVRLSRIHRPLIRALSVLELHKVHEVSPDWIDYGVPSWLPSPAIHAVRRLFDLGADSAVVIEPVPAGDADILFSFHGVVSASFDQLHEIVQERAAAKVAKLLRAVADERHLFVWLDSTYSEAELAVSTLPPPVVALEPPRGIDAIWLATRPFTDPRHIWILNPATGWRVVR